MGLSQPCSLLLAACVFLIPALTSCQAFERYHLDEAEDMGLVKFNTGYCLNKNGNKERNGYKQYTLDDVVICWEKCRVDRDCDGFEFSYTAKKHQCELHRNLSGFQPSKNPNRLCYNKVKDEKEKDTGKGRQGEKHNAVYCDGGNEVESHLVFKSNPGYCRNSQIPQSKFKNGYKRYKGVKCQNACQKFCADDRMCDAFEWNPKNTTCELHKKIKSYKPQKGVYCYSIDSGARKPITKCTSC